jgi:hypothetical protein
MDEQPTTDTQDQDTLGSQDGPGANDNDQPFFGFRTYQFSTRQLARLLQLRGQLLEARLGQGAWAQDLGMSR